MTTNQALRYFGGVTQLAKALDISRSAVYQWGDRPPFYRQCHIEVVTGGALRADIKPSQRRLAKQQ